MMIWVIHARHWIERLSERRKPKTTIVDLAKKRRERYGTKGDSDG